VLVYKASRVMNFALGEWMMVGALLAAAALRVPALGVTGALAVAGAGMVALALVFERVVLRRLAGRPVIAMLMVTLGLGTLLRGAAAVLFRGVPGAIALPVRRAPVEVHGLAISSERLAAALVAVVAIGVVTALFRWSRTGLALRAIADDEDAAVAVGIDLRRHLAITWSALGVLCVVAGTLWAAVTGGSVGVVVLGLKVFPVVVIGGLDSIPGALVGAILVGVLESVVAGYVDPLVGGGFGTVAAFVVALAVLLARPSGLLGAADVRRV
jgi:branched-chain amino acid transport system permease protein